MRIFMTGASGLIGSAVGPMLLQRGHEVVALTRSQQAAAKVQSWGADVLEGDLEDLETLRRGASESDGVIHLAFRHDLLTAPAGMAQGAAVDRQAIDTMGDALAGTGRPLVVASGTPALPGRVSVESDEPRPDGPGGARGENARAVVAMEERGVRSSVVRLPRSVHGDTDLHGFIPRLITIARERGVSGYVGDGSSRWPAVHVLDAARLFCMAVEEAPAGTVLHAVGDEGVATRDIAAVIGRKLNLPTASAEPDQYGFLGMVMSIDQPASSAQTRALIGWEPEQHGLIADMESGHYFAAHVTRTLANT